MTLAASDSSGSISSFFPAAELFSPQLVLLWLLGNLSARALLKQMQTKIISATDLAVLCPPLNDEEKRTERRKLRLICVEIQAGFILSEMFPFL